MSPEAQKIALAEALGWTNVVFVPETGNVVGKRPDGNPFRFPAPDFDSIDVLHEAEKALPSGHAYWKFVEILNGIVKREPYTAYVADRASATAAQRREALLKTLNLWDETK